MMATRARMEISKHVENRTSERIVSLSSRWKRMGQ